MIALKIQDIKQFMNALLRTEIFDPFLFVEGTIQGANTFIIDGRLNRDFFDTDELNSPALAGRQFSYFRELRPLCFELIKGKRTPLGFKFVFQLSASNTEKLLAQAQIGLTPDQVQGLLLNVRYDGQTLTCITGTSLRIFTLDKELEQAWDDMVQKFFHQQELPFLLE